jgi:amidophosphoribosyltransferase
MCGLIGIKNVRKAAELAVVGAHELQHRARTYAGAASSDGERMYMHAGKGLAREVFTSAWLNRLHGTDAVVHVRYPTDADMEDRDNTQPIRGIYKGKDFALAHNGNLTNVKELRELLPQGSKFSTSTDSEYIVRLIEHLQTGNLRQDLSRVFSLLKGSFALVILMHDCVIAVMDSRNNHPLSIAKLNDGYCVASETCAFPIVGAKFLMDVAPGTFTVITKQGLAHTTFAQADMKRCVFELLYNSHVASRVFDVGVTRFRVAIGVELEKLFPVDGGDTDLIVTPVPDSGRPYAQGFAKNGRSGEDFQVIWRNHYVGRTFNAATQALRDEEVSRKFMFDADEIKGKRVVVLDDSIVRGTTLPKIINMLWQLGAKEVHARIATPAIKHICHYGIYMDEDDTDLIAAKLTPPQMAKKMGATSLEFLPLPELQRLLPDPTSYCFACMNGDYWK